MSKRRRRNNNFIMQGTILAAAGLIVRIIGLIYRIPMTNIIGDEGMGYYSFAFEPYSVMLLLSYHGLPTAVSKLVAERNGEGRFKNSYRVFRVAMVLAIVIGALTGAIIYFGADYIAGGLNNQPMSAYALKVLGPTIFVLAIMGILRGYFQGMGTTVPTALSQIFEAIANAIVSVVAAGYLFEAGKKFDLVVNSKSHAEAYGAAGGTLGTLVGAAAGLFFLVFVFMMFKPMLYKQMRKDHTGRKESYGGLVSILILTAAPIVLSSVIFNISTTVDGAIFSSVMQGKHKMPEGEVASLWGIFTNKY
ncbi:MAG: oligosaccharide flippase family protein, partial [Lachnospiraceae bacterium]|nr:oligosaccharide flippase family protein [Lachnospiraceae bacterium]